MAMTQAFGTLFFIIWLILLIGSIAAGVLLIIAVWRGMVAHESIAGSMKEIAEALKMQKTTE